MSYLGFVLLPMSLSVHLSRACDVLGTMRNTKTIVMHLTGLGKGHWMVLFREPGARWYSTPLPVGWGPFYSIGVINISKDPRRKIPNTQLVDEWALSSLTCLSLLLTSLIISQMWGQETEKQKCILPAAVNRRNWPFKVTTVPNSLISKWSWKWAGLDT